MAQKHIKSPRSFVLRLWSAPQAGDQTQWRGQLECVVSQEKAHFHNPDGLIKAVAHWVPGFGADEKPPLKEASS